MSQQKAYSLWKGAQPANWVSCAWGRIILSFQQTEVVFRQAEKQAREAAAAELQKHKKKPTSVFN